MKYVLIFFSYVSLFLLVGFSQLSADDTTAFIENDLLAIFTYSLPWLCVVGLNLSLQRRDRSTLRTAGLFVSSVLLLPVINFFFCVIVVTPFVQ